MPSGAECKSGVCDCDEANSYKYVAGRCRLLKNLGQACAADVDCYFAYDRQSVSCRGDICGCAKGYYKRHGSVCRRKSMEIGGPCVVDSDCDELRPKPKCSNLQCQYETLKRNAASKGKSEVAVEKKSGTPPASIAKNLNENGIGADLQTTTETDSESEAITIRDIAIQTSFESKGKSSRSRSKNVRSIGTTTSNSNSSRRDSSNKRSRRTFYFDESYSTISNTDEDAEVKKYGSSCDTNGKPCKELTHSVCSRNMCYCKPGYYPKGGKCFAELGEIAESADDCEFDFDEVSNKCICPQNYFFDRDLRGCRKPIQYHLSCTSDAQCSPFGAAFCQREIPRRCVCEEFAEYDAKQQLCSYKEGLGSQCDTDTACLMEHSVCSHNRCGCKPQYIPHDGQCKAGVGGPCLEQLDCALKNSTCGKLRGERGDHRDDLETERTCTCKKGFVHFKDECLKEADDLGDECVDTEQCQPLLAECVVQKCECAGGHHFQNGQCLLKKSLGETCLKASECFAEKDPESIECRNSVCQCKFGLQVENDRTKCARAISVTNKSSGRPSCLKVTTYALILSASLIIIAAFIDRLVIAS